MGQMRNSLGVTVYVCGGGLGFVNVAIGMDVNIVIGAEWHGREWQRVGGSWGWGGVARNRKGGACSIQTGWQRVPFPYYRFPRLSGPHTERPVRGPDLVAAHNIVQAVLGRRDVCADFEFSGQSRQHTQGGRLESGHDGVAVSVVVVRKHRGRAVGSGDTIVSVRKKSGGLGGVGVHGHFGPGAQHGRDRARVGFVFKREKLLRAGRVGAVRYILLKISRRGTCGAALHVPRQ